MRKTLSTEILEREWKMFSTVANAGGKANCQEDPETFRIMRGSQIGDWPDELLASWLEDLRQAGRAGRNLMSEKYARMMEATFPAEYERLAAGLPSPAQETLALIEEIVAVNLDWKMEIAGRYPALNGRGRPIYTQDDSRWETSFETYLRGELKTYSAKTNRLLHAFTLKQKRGGVNGVETTLLAQVKMYGYASLAEAEKALL